mgnify:CR=1 FL=1
MPIELGTLVSRFDPTCTTMNDSETARHVENTRRRTVTESNTDYRERGQRGHHAELFGNRRKMVHVKLYNDSSMGVAVITMQIQLSLDQINAMGYDNCYSLINGLYDRLVTPGFAMQFATGYDSTQIYGNNPLLGVSAPSFKPVRALGNYCKFPILNHTNIDVYLSPQGTP